ncbi:MAG: hypothetical protein Q9159_005499 [Coniocarpon cinnabarinum]
MGLSPGPAAQQQAAPDATTDANDVSGARSNIPVSISIRSSDDQASASTQTPSYRDTQSLVDLVRDARGDPLQELGDESARSETPEPAFAISQPSHTRHPLGTTFFRKFLSSPPSPGVDSVPMSTPRTASMKSMQLSDEDGSIDEEASQAVASSAEEDDIDASNGHDGLEDQYAQAAPQLIMPSVTMPRRRPFTKRGKDVGRLKIMIAGQKGLGKTSLIKSIVQICEDIVHVDPMDADAAKFAISEAGHVHARAPSSPRDSRSQMREIYASTRAYPTWLAEAESNYRELSDKSVLIKVGRRKLTSAELEVLQHISRCSNLVPLLSQADTHSEQELTDARTALAEQLQEAEVECFDMPMPPVSPGLASSGRRLIAISSTPARDDEVIDASLLMSSGYVQPLEVSDLQKLTETLFDPETAARLRHSALRKLFQWKHRQAVPRPLTSSNALRAAQQGPHHISLPAFSRRSTLPATANSVADSSAPASSAIWVEGTMSGSQNERPLSTSSNALQRPETFSTARVRDHAQREERLAQVRLARWAADLQRALHSERARFATLKQAERTAWLQERLEKSIDPHTDESDPAKALQKRSRETGQFQRYRSSAGDPLGLFEWRARLSDRGVMVANVVGGAGIFGAVVVWVVRTWGWSSLFGGGDGTGSWCWAKDW